MTISFRKYVDITSGVGGAAIVAARDLIGRIFTSSPIASVDAIMEFESAAEVGEVFGTASVEYLRALFYFAWTSVTLQQARKISFAAYPTADAAPAVVGKGKTFSLATLTAITTGNIQFSFGGVLETIAAIDFSGAVSLSGVAALLQTAIRTGTDPQLATATVVYDAANSRFVVTGTVTGPGNMEIVASTAPDVGAALNLLATQGAIVVAGTDAMEPSEAFTTAMNVSNNFGSFLFMPAITVEQAEAVALANAAESVSYMFMLRAEDSAEAAALNAALIAISGVAVTLAPDAAEYDEMVPMIQLAATNYELRNATSNYMFKQFALTPKVSDTGESNDLDALRCNYYGRTQINGQQLAFYQQGTLMGGVSAPTDQNVYANEQWLSSYLTAAFLNALLSLARIPANADGEAIGGGIVQDGVDAALFNGTISAGKDLTQLQKVYITQVSGDVTAWQQVQTIGYWYNVRIVPEVLESSVTIYKIIYTLIYSKDDAVRKVEGTHNLI